jgi:anti-sigma B factor antagonist
MMDIKLYILKNTGLLVISVRILGDADAPDLPAKVKDLISNGIKNIILDLSTAKAINSIGIGTLLECLSAVEKVSGKLKLADVSDKIMEILNRTEVSRLFNIYDSVDSALVDSHPDPGENY